MIGIAIATAAAGIVVGTVSITGFGLVMTDLVETISAGNMIGMLCLVAVICLILGMGMPTTASYIVVSTLMAPVVVELGAQSGLVVPLVAVHMFVFYFGLMADVTPPVGLAAFAAAAISRGDYLRTGFTAFWYSIRTGILPFMFIFNTELLLIGINSFAHLVLVVVRGHRGDAGVRRGDAGLVHHAQPLVRVGRDAARDVHAAAPGLLDGFRVSEIRRRATAEIHGIRRLGAAQHRPARAHRGHDRRGQGHEEDRPAAAWQAKAPRRSASRAPDLTTMTVPAGIQIAAVNLHSAADKAGFEQGFTVTGIETEAQRPAKEWLFVPALLVLGTVVLLQRRRVRSRTATVAAPAD